MMIGGLTWLAIGLGCRPNLVYPLCKDRLLLSVVTAETFEIPFGYFTFIKL